ncbi:sterol 14-demethylase-like [Cajanus cajan]|uniref:sterol 14-demethylase-like n=1 Tax=Cajanus cajan TaxID=3821 RepID=UPI00098DD106|nr:sterol 14-demethylase-like [Cajanus cajan]
MEVDGRFLSTCLLLAATILVAKLISAFIVPKSRKRVPPVVKGWPLIGGLYRFLKGPIFMLREEYPKLGSVFTLKLFHKNITFLIGPEVSAHFFKAPESDLSQQEVYQFNVPTFGPGVVFDVDYSVRQEQFRFFTEALRVNKLKSYVNQMVAEAEVCGDLF